MYTVTLSEASMGRGRPRVLVTLLKEFTFERFRQKSMPLMIRGEKYDGSRTEVKEHER